MESSLVFSSFCEIMVDFTREYDTIKEALVNVEQYDKTCVEKMLLSVKEILLSNWGSQNQSQVIIFTDGGIGFGQTSLRATVANLRKRNFADSEANSSLCLPFNINSSRLNIVCIGRTDDVCVQGALILYQQLLDVSGQDGELFVTPAISGGDEHPKGLNATVIRDMVQRMCETNYKPFEAVLKCGGYARLESAVNVWPGPLPYVNKQSGTSQEIKRCLEVCGYIPLAEVGSPMSVSRHLILPIGGGHAASAATIAAAKFNSAASAGENDETAAPFDHERIEADIKSFYSKSENPASDEESQAVAPFTLNDSNTESVCVLLHGALKIESLAALVVLGDNWFGFICSFADSKKKSNLMLTILPPGPDVVPWLGDLRYIGTVEDLQPGETPTPFPVKPEKRSYSQNCVVWIKQAGLQADVQKLLRHAKKLPEKTQSFYKELNRICKAAMSMGFVELLVDGLSQMFEREIVLLPNNASPDCALQLQHTAQELRMIGSRETYDAKMLISALPTKYNLL